MHKSFLAAAALILTAPILALASVLPAGADKALSSAGGNAAAEDAASHAALKVSFQLNHQYLRKYESEDELFEHEWEYFTIYVYRALPSEQAQAERDEDGTYFIESETRLEGRQLLRTESHRVARPYSSVYQYRVECRAYALTNNWAVMSGNCLNPAFHRKSDRIVIGGLDYEPEPVNVRLNGKISVEGKEASAYYHTAQLTLLYAAANTPLSRVLAGAPKVNLRILDRPEEIFRISGGNFLVNGKSRSLKGDSLNGRNVQLDEPWTTPTAGRASDAMFYVKNGRALIAGFNNGQIASVPNIELDLLHRWDECTREKSSSYYTLNKNDLKFIRNKTGRDWNAVRQHIFVSVK